MQFISPKEGWLGVGAAEMLHTTDGGLTWSRQRTGMNENPIVDLHFINGLEGWAVLRERLDGGAREGGVILHTTDGGNYWKVLDNTNQPAIAVHFADSKSGWVVLTNGASIVTHDGGINWKRVLSDSDSGWPPRRIGRITFQNHQTAWALGGDGRLFITRNGGQTWKGANVPQHESSVNAGIAGADGEDIDWLALWLEEGGESDDSTDEQPGDIDNPLDENFAEQFQTEMSDRRQRTGRFTPEGDLGGENVQPSNEVQRQRRAAQQDRPQPQRNRRRGNRLINNIHFVDDQIAWAVGEAGHIFHTTNGGKTWERQLGEQLDDFRDVLFLNDHQGWIAGDNGLLLETQDGGGTWTTLNSRSRQRLIGVHFPSLDPKWGWAMRRDGTVLYTTDGENWSAGETPMRPGFFEDDPPRSFSINEVMFKQFSEGWAAGSDGQIIHNQDGGPIWTPQRTSTGKNLYGIDMKHAPLGWAVGDDGIVQRTINGGGYWKFHETNTGYSLYDVSFITKRKGWAVGAYGIILRTTGGGFKWEPLSSGVTADLYSVTALSKDEIYAVGSKGTILHSTDGGDTWEQEHTDIGNNLYRIVRAKEGDTLWVVGQWGVVLRRKIGDTQVSMR